MLVVASSFFPTGKIKMSEKIKKSSRLLERLALLYAEVREISGGPGAEVFTGKYF